MNILRRYRLPRLNTVCFSKMTRVNWVGEFQMENSASIMYVVFLLHIHLRDLSFCSRDWREE